MEHEITENLNAGILSTSFDNYNTEVIMYEVFTTMQVITKYLRENFSLE